MGLNPALEALTVPSGTEFPPTVQALLDLIAQYESVVGLSSFNGINFGPTEPDEDNRDKPWFKTDDSGNGLGWFSWNGAAWALIPTVILSGTTAERPTSPQEGQLYLDTDIDVPLIYERSAWRTVSGSPGDLKEVIADSVSDAMTQNPGWSEHTASIGYVIAGASDGSATSPGDTAGADSVLITQNDLPPDTINLASGWYPYSGQHQNGTQPAGVYPIVTGQSSTAETGPLNPGVQSALNLWQPTKFYVRLVKD